MLTKYDMIEEKKCDREKTEPCNFSFLFIIINSKLREERKEGRTYKAGR